MTPMRNTPMRASKCNPNISPPTTMNASHIMLRFVNKIKKRSKSFLAVGGGDAGSAWRVNFLVIHSPISNMICRISALRLRISIMSPLMGNPRIGTNGCCDYGGRLDGMVQRRFAMRINSRNWQCFSSEQEPLIGIWQTVRCTWADFVGGLPLIIRCYGAQAGQ